MSSLVVAGLCSVLALVNFGLAAAPADAYVIRDTGDRPLGTFRVRPIRTRIHVSALTRVTPEEAASFVPDNACPYPAAGAQPQWSLFPCTEFYAPPPRYRRDHREISWAGTHFFAQFPASATATVTRAVVRSERHKIILHARY